MAQFVSKSGIFRTVSENLFSSIVLLGYAYYINLWSITATQYLETKTFIWRKTYFPGRSSSSGF